jgi:hypothetical protein
LLKYPLKQGIFNKHIHRKLLASSFLERPFFEESSREGFLVLRPGFEPGSSARKAEILNLTILSEPKQGINQNKHTQFLTFRR